MSDEIPRLSPSIAHLILTESPRHAWWYHRLLGGHTKPPTDEQERGRLIHALVLGETHLIEVVDADSFRSKEARMARDIARASGKIPVIREKYDAAWGIAARIREYALKVGIELSEGASEVRVEWSQKTLRGPIDCSGHLDWLDLERGLIVDLKTTDGSCHPDQCANKLVREGGCIQAAAYRRAIETTQPHLAGRVDVMFLFCQTSEPWGFAPVVCSGSMMQLGESRWRRASEIWASCLTAGRAIENWPGYAEGNQPLVVDAPAWALNAEMVAGETYD